MRNPNSRDAAADPDAPVDADVGSRGAVKRFFADFRALKLHVDDAASRERFAKQSMSTMTRFLAGELPPEIAAEVEAFLRDEPLVREIYAGLFAAWQAPNAERSVTADEVDAGYARFRAKVAAKSRAPENGASNR
jgi:hypothetical protein